MSVADLAERALLDPLLEVYAAAFNALLEWLSSPGLAIVLFGVLVNIVLTPVYFQMERAGRRGAALREEMNREIARLKKHYSGREAYFYIRTVHRQYGYHPLRVLLSSGDLLLQILVFATVYRFLAGHPMISGAEFSFIEDLAEPDRLALGVNVLPILMTLLNVGSALLYSDSKSKRATAFALAALFLVLLYNSPAGLVLYWTTNNAFSLIRNYLVRKISPAVPAGIRRALATALEQR